MPDVHPESGGRTDDPKALTTVLVGLIGIALTAVVVMALEVLYYRTAEAENVRKVVAETSEDLLRARTDSMEKLNAYRWVDRENGVVAIPIDRAMELMVDEAKTPGEGR